MSDSTLRLPARPSLEQLRKQAKELLRDYRAGSIAAVERLSAVIPRLADTAQSGDVTLADAQFVLAREYGFESWAKLAHHVETVNPSERRERYEKLAVDLVAACGGDAEALERLNEQFPRALTLDQLRELIQQRMNALSDSASGIANFTLADAQMLVARQHGFDSWAKFVESFAQPPSAPRSTPIGLSSTPPFYKIDWKSNTIEPGPLMSDKDWDTVFDVMKEHRITGLNANGQMTDAALKRLPRLGFVTTLNLDGSTRVTDEGLKHLARMPQLRELNLNGWESAITDRGLEVLRHLTELRRFQMCWPQRVTDAGAANLKFCENLERVDLMGTQTGDGAIDALTGKRHLRHFKTGQGVTAAGLSLLHQFPMFKTWQGGETKYALMEFEAEPTYLLFPPRHFTEQGLDRLVGLDGLFALNIDGPVQMTAEGIAPLAQLPNLGWLGVDPTDEAMRHIAAMPRLRMLMCQDTKAGDEGFESLSRSLTIEYIWGRKCYGLTGRGFASLAAMPSLRGLSVSCKNVDDAALSALPRFPALRGLMPMDVLDDGFRHVGRCEQLENLWCMYCRDTGDAATEHIAGLSKLKTYYAGATKITDRSLEILGRMTSLETIEFWECAGITD
ncbi:MAG: hypothetical protein ACREBD_18010, partial [Blastocatellia bacterium]